jgi:lactoylglutathione lyase
MRMHVVAALAVAALHMGTQPAQPARPPVFGISHVAIQVSDLAKARAFYGELLGFAEQAPRRDHSAIFVVNDRQRRIVRDGLPASRDERFLGLAFETELATMRTRLAERRITVSAPRDDAEAGGTRIDVADPDGHPLVFVEHKEANEIPASADRRISRRILHAGLTIKDPVAADRFYKDVLGFAEIWRGGRPEGTISWINMRVPDGTDYLEYMLYPAAPPTRRQLGSAHHVALMVPDIQQALETVRARTNPGDPNHTASPNIGVNNRWQLNVFDPDGTRVEFMEAWTAR